MSSLTTSNGLRIEEVRGEGMAQRMRRIGLRDPCRLEILGHQMLDGADAQRCAGWRGLGKTYVASNGWV